MSFIIENGLSPPFGGILLDTVFSSLSRGGMSRSIENTLDVSLHFTAACLLFILKRRHYISIHLLIYL